MAGVPCVPREDSLALLRGALSGNERAERELLLRVIIPVVEAAVCQEMLCARRLRLDVEDTVQDVLDHLSECGWARLRRFDPGRGTLEAYVSRIARNLAVDILRRPRLSEGDQDEIETCAVSDSGPESNVRLGEQIDRLAAALKPDDLLLLRWLWFEGVERREIAARLGIPVDTLYKRIQRLEKQVRAILGGEGDVAEHIYEEQPT